MTEEIQFMNMGRPNAQRWKAAEECLEGMLSGNTYQLQSLQGPIQTDPLIQHFYRAQVYIPQKAVTWEAFVKLCLLPEDGDYVFASPVELESLRICELDHPSDLSKVDFVELSHYLKQFQDLSALRKAEPEEELPAEEDFSTPHEEVVDVVVAHFESKGVEAAEDEVKDMPDIAERNLPDGWELHIAGCYPTDGVEHEMWLTTVSVEKSVIRDFMQSYNVACHIDKSDKTLERHHRVNYTGACIVCKTPIEAFPPNRLHLCHHCNTMQAIRKPIKRRGNTDE